MKHFLDTSALLAHYLGEPGAETVQALFEDASASLGVSILVLYEFDFWLSQLGLGEAVRAAELRKYRSLHDEIAPVDERIRSEGARLRAAALERVSEIDIQGGGGQPGAFGSDP